MYSTFRGPLSGLPYGRISRSYLWGDNPASVAPFIPSPPDVVRKMLEVAEVGQDDVLYDLGCGDGRILLMAVQEFKVKKAVGFDLNKTFCDTITKKVGELHLQDRIQAINENFFLADLSPATVITLYLTTSGNEKLKPKLESESKPGTRIVSHDFPIKGWIPSGAEPHIFNTHSLYLYRIPEAYPPKTSVKDSASSTLQRMRGLFFRP
jgi:hypothetical protein